MPRELILMPRLDELPPLSTVEVDMTRIPFEARYRGVDQEGRRSRWTEWYDLNDLPEMIFWADFWKGMPGRG